MHTARPAETTAAASAAAIVVAYLLGIRDAEVILALAGLLGLVPAGVTWVVEQSRSHRGLP